EPAGRLRRLARGNDVRRRGRRVVFGAFAQVLAVDERIVQFAFAYLAHDVFQVRIDGAVRKQPQVQLALDLLRKGRPIAAYDFHADELHGVSTVGESRIALAGAARAVPCLG